MAHGKLVRDLGTSFFLERMRGTYFIYNDKVLQLYDTFDNEFFVARDLAGNIVKVEGSVFEDFKFFKWPALGYRRIGDKAVVRIYKQRIYGGGLRREAIGLEYSPFATFMAENGINAKCDDTEYVPQIYMPVYDTIEHLPLLFSGDLPGLVFSEQTMIEPTVRVDGDVYDIHHRGNVIASVSPDMEITATNSPNRAFARKVLNVQA